MITIKEFPEQSFETKEAMFTQLRENKKVLISQKKMTTKESDAVVFLPKTKEVINYKEATKEAVTIATEGLSTICLGLVINTTNVLDSHSDVHLSGIWNKSVKEKKDLYLLQEHRMKFDSIITDKVKASVKKLSWDELGASFSGDTEALVFDVEIDKDRHEFMFNQYAKGYVKNHSVGMRYVKIELALNSENKYDVEEKAVWDKYISEIVNKEEAEAQGYFWAVSEAKIIEGSAVVLGSNTITPVLENTKEAVSNTSLKSEPFSDTQQTDEGIKEFYKSLL